MPHRQSIRTWTCTTCRAEFHYAPTIHVGVAFCCAGCAAGGPCICSYDDDRGGAAAEAWRVPEPVGVD